MASVKRQATTGRLIKPPKVPKPFEVPPPTPNLKLKASKNTPTKRTPKKTTPATTTRSQTSRYLEPVPDPWAQRPVTRSQLPRVNKVAMTGDKSVERHLADPQDADTPAITSGSEPPPRSTRVKPKKQQQEPDPMSLLRDALDYDNIENHLPAHLVELADDNDDSPLSDVESPLPQEIIDPMPTNNPSANRGWARKGKEPVRDRPAPEDVVMIDTDEPEPVYEDEDVDEGVIDYNDHTPNEHELDPEDDVPPETVVLDDSDDEGDAGNAIEDQKKTKQEEKNPFSLTERPWTVEGFDEGMRRQWETMYCQVQTQPLCGSWELTEQYQFEKDKEQLRYIEDVPLPQWSIRKEQAEQAYFRLLERSRWRSLGIRIYGSQRIPEIIPQSTPSSFGRSSDIRLHPLGMMSNANIQAFGPVPQTMSGFGVNRPPSGSQQQVPHRPPPGQAMASPHHQMLHSNQVLRSQPTVPNGMPPNGPSGRHQQSGHPQRMMGPPPLSQQPQFGHPSHVGGPHGMPYSIGPNPPHVHHANVPMQQPMPGYSSMPGVPQGTVPAGMHGHGQSPSAATGKGGRRKKETPPPPTPPPPPPTPPYKVRDRPAERKKFNKTAKRNIRKQAEAEEFPWHRQVDFKKLRATAAWPEDRYEKGILDQMKEVRKLNGPIIQRLDDELAEKQKAARNRKKAAGGGRRGRGGRGVDETPSGDAGEGSYGDDEGRNKSTTPRRKNENIGGDPYYSGNFSFATEADRQRALVLHYKTPDDILDAAEAGKVDWELCKKILICWNPGKKGTTQELVQATFRIYDTLVTREQYDSTPILTKRAAECIVDFCPDMLWRETLLRIVSEAGYGNKDVRDRFCYNGCYADKATVTKRIGAALGQKQQNNTKRKELQLAALEAAKEIEEQGGKSKRRGPEPKGKGGRYLEGEEEWHEGNKLDFENYIRFFGKRAAGRKSAKAGEKRKKGESEDPENEDSAGGSRRGSSSKRARTEETDAAATSPMSSELSEALSAEEESEDDEDAVSEQSDGVLDEIED